MRVCFLIFPKAVPVRTATHRIIPRRKRTRRATEAACRRSGATAPPGLTVVSPVDGAAAAARATSSNGDRNNTAGATRVAATTARTGITLPLSATRPSSSRSYRGTYDQRSRQPTYAGYPQEGRRSQQVRLSIDCLILIDCYIAWLFDWSVHCYIDWLVDQFIDQLHWLLHCWQCAVESWFFIRHFFSDSTFGRVHWVSFWVSFQPVLFESKKGSDGVFSFQSSNWMSQNNPLFDDYSQGSSAYSRQISDGQRWGRNQPEQQSQWSQSRYSGYSQPRQQYNETGYSGSQGWTDQQGDQQWRIENPQQQQYHDSGRNYGSSQQYGGAGQYGQFSPQRGEPQGRYSGSGSSSSGMGQRGGQYGSLDGQGRRMNSDQQQYGSDQYGSSWARDRADQSGYGGSATYGMAAGAAHISGVKALRTFLSHFAPIDISKSRISLIDSD